MSLPIFQAPSRVLLSVSHKQQKQHGDCLATCVDMVLTYLGGSFSISQIAKALEQKPNLGTPFSNIQKLEKLNILVGYRQHGSLDTLYTLLRHGWPIIASVNTEPLPYWNLDTGHAVVVVGMDDRSIFLNDPDISDGPIQILIGDFDLAWLEQDERYAVLAL